MAKAVALTAADLSPGKPRAQSVMRQRGVVPSSEGQGMTNKKGFQAVGAVMQQLREQGAAVLVDLAGDGAPVAGADALLPLVCSVLRPRGGAHAAASRLRRVSLASGPPT